VEVILIIVIVSVISKIIKKAKEQEQVQRAPVVTKTTTPQVPRQNTQPQQATRDSKNPTILERAIANAEEDKVDVTLQTMEEEHNHSERVAPAIHHHPEDIISENMLGTVDDLMIKGYDGNLCFERDFVGEAMDMISRFSLGGNYGA